MEEKWLKIIYWTILIAGVLITLLTALQNSILQKLEKNRKLEEGNPLFPLKVIGVVNLDFSKAKPDQQVIIEDYKNYLFQFLDSTGNYYDHLGKELPKNLFLNRDAVAYKNFKMNQSTIENSGCGAFFVKHMNFVNTFLPNVFLAFMEKDELKDKYSDNKMNLLLQIFNYDSENECDIELTYRIDFNSKKIVLQFTTNKPKIETNDGLIKSIFSSRGGWVGVGFDDFKENGIECNLDRIELNYGIDFRSKTIISFFDDSIFKNRKIIDDFYSRSYYFKRGSDILKQHEK